VFVKGDIVSSQCTVQVNRYTEGSVSPDPMLTHKRTISNVTNMSGHSFSSEAAARLGDVLFWVCCWGVLLGDMLLVDMLLGDVLFGVCCC